MQYSSRLFRVEDGQVITVFAKTSRASSFDLKLANANYIDDISDVHLNFSLIFGANGEIERNFDSSGLICDNALTGSVEPFVKGDDLKIDIIVFRALFFVLVDGKPFCVFPTQLPLNEIQKLVVVGDFDSISGVNQKNILPTPEPSEHQVWQGMTPDNFKTGNLIVITAIPRNESGNLAINFRETTKTPILLQLSVVYGGSNLDLKWRSQSFTHEENPIVADQPFKLAILLGDTEFYVAINGNQLTSFQYDDDVDKILGNLNVLEILTARGLQFDVQGIDYMRIHPDHWPSYETFNR